MVRAAWLAATVAIAAVIAGSSPPTRGNPTTILPGRHGELEPLSVTLVDTTGLAVEIQPVSDVEAAFFGAPVALVPDDASALVVFWVGGECANRASLVLRGADRRYELEVTEDSSLVGLLGCSAVGIGRSVRIQFTRPIDPKELMVRQRFK